MKSGTSRVETEVTEKAKRRRFSTSYKLRIVREAAACTEVGGVGALLRREGLYSSQLTKWRRQAENGELTGLKPKRRGPHPKPRDERDKKIQHLQKQVDKLTWRAERAEALVDAQKKLSQILGIALPDADQEPRS